MTEFPNIMNRARIRMDENRQRILHNIKTSKTPNLGYPTRSTMIQDLALAGREVADCDEWSLAELRVAWSHLPR